MRAETRLRRAERRLARIAAGQAGARDSRVRASGWEADSEAVRSVSRRRGSRRRSDELRTAEQVTRLRDRRDRCPGRPPLASWREGELELVASVGATGTADARRRAGSRCSRAASAASAVSVERVVGLPGAATLLGDAATGSALRSARCSSSFASDTEAGDVDPRDAGDVRRARRSRPAGERHARTSVELELGSHACAARPSSARRSRELSLAHTLETAVARVGELLEADRLAVYLREDDHAVCRRAGIGLAGPHARLRRTAARAHARPASLTRDARRPTTSLRITVWRAWPTRQQRRGSRPRSRSRCSRVTDVIGLLGVFHRARPRPDGERVGAAGRARRAAGGRGAERAAARAREAAR